jgi:hypothetical protein
MYIRQLLDVIETTGVLPKSSPEYDHASRRATADLLEMLSKHGHVAPSAQKSSDLPLPSPSNINVVIRLIKGLGMWVLDNTHPNADILHKYVTQKEMLNPSESYSIVTLEEWWKHQKTHHHPGLAPDFPGTGSGVDVESPELNTVLSQNFALFEPYQSNPGGPASPGPKSTLPSSYPEVPGTLQWAANPGEDSETDE